MEAQDYKYNIVNEDTDGSAWNQNFTSRIGDGTGNPEEEYFSLLSVIVNCKPNARFLDIGCGRGRIVRRVKDRVGSLVGLEPDCERCQICFIRHDDGDRIRIINATSQQYKIAHPKDRFDIIVASMVLQHVPTDVCQQILCNVHDLLSSDGVGVISTTQQDAERFIYQSNTTLRSVAEFDSYASNTARQQWGVPVRMFTKASFCDSIRLADLSIVHWGQFSYIRPKKLEWIGAHFGAPPEALKDLGTSQYAVVRRCSPSGN